MFKPKSVKTHKLRLHYSEDSREIKHPLRANHGSFPTLRNPFDDLNQPVASETMANKANVEEKVSQISALVPMDYPEALPGDCSVKEFVLEKVTPYHGDATFLASATERTLKTWKRCEDLMELERQKGILDVDTKTVSTVTSHGPGYVLSKEEDVIHGLQTDEPLKRSCKPRGGFKVVRGALESYGYKADPDMEKTYTQVSSTVD
jgi:hypothetical protein